MAHYGIERALVLYGSREENRSITYDTWRTAAEGVLSPERFAYVDGGAGRETTVRANAEAFDGWRIVPRMLQGRDESDLSCRILGEELPFPLLLAPIGVQSECHSEAELATARAAGRTSMPFVLSTVSSFTLEDVAAASGEAPRWFQLYPSRDFEVNRSLVARAEAAGYRALVVTLDTTVVGFRPRDLAYAHLPFIRGFGIANYVVDPAFEAGLGHPPRPDDPATIQHFLRVYLNPSLAWSDIDRIVGLTRLPVLLKGVLHPDDARAALDHGAKGVIVSNHGGRQVDGAISSLQALPGVRKALGHDAAVLMDGGIRSAADVVKALCLGADAILIGRLYAFALAAAGSPGVEAVIRNLLAEFDLELLLSGHPAVRDLSPGDLTPAH